MRFGGGRFAGGRFGDGRFSGRSVSSPPQSPLAIIGDDAGNYTATGGDGDWSVTVTGAGVPYDGVYAVTDTADPNQIGWLQEAPVTGTPGVGGVLTVAEPLWYSEGSGTQTETNVVKRDGVTIATNVTLPYDYTQIAGDDSGGVTIEITISNTFNQLTSIREIVADGNAAAVVSGSTVSPTYLIDPDGDGKNWNLYELNTAGDHADWITFSSGGKVQLLLPGGGAGAGSRAGGGGQGGGGGGEVLYFSAFSVLGQAYSGTVGAGGTGGDSGGAPTNGGATTFAGVTAGGGGAGGHSSTGSDGANGGGSASTIGTGLSGQGNAGGFDGGYSSTTSFGAGGGGGGAGAGANGADGSGDNGGAGGAGTSNSITGTAVDYGGGGGGAASRDNRVGGAGGSGGGGTGAGATGEDPTPGVDGLGGGGGAGTSWSTHATWTGQDGGCGSIKIRVEVD